MYEKENVMPYSNCDCIFNLLYRIFQAFITFRCAEADNQMKMIYSQIGVENGEAYIDSVNYQDITIDQKNAILSLLDKYTYRRTVGTLFSNGSTSDLGNKTLSIYVYDDDLLINSVFATSSGKVVINEKTYNMEDAERFIEQMIEIMN